MLYNTRLILIAHSRNRDDIYKKMKKVKVHTYTVFAGQIPRKGYAVAFYGEI